MLLHYYTHSILFWLGLPNFKPNEDLAKNLQSFDFEYLPREVCIAQCIKGSRMEIVPKVEGQIGEALNKTSLEICRDNCLAMNTTQVAQVSSSAATKSGTSTVKQIHENYSLNLICRDESSLHFLIDLHRLNKGGEQIKYMRKRSEADIATSSDATTAITTSTSSLAASPPSSASSPSSSSTFPSSYEQEYANPNESEGNEEYETLFVIKIHMANDADHFFAYLSDDNFFTIDKLLPNTTYNMSVMAVHSNNKYSVITQQQQFQTLRRSFTPGNVTEIKVTNFTEDEVNKMHLSATMTWKPPADMTCHYDIICFSTAGEEYDLQPLEIRNPRQLYKYQLENLTFSSVYKVGIRARNTKNMKESELFWKTFQAPSCVEWYNYNFNICAPDAPQNLHVEQIYVEPNSYSFNVTWILPAHLPDYYTLRIQDLSPHRPLEVYNVTKELNNFFLPLVTIYGVFFEVSLTAYTPGGQSTATFTDFTKTIVHMPEKNPFVKLIAVILAPIFCVAILSLTIFMIYHRRAKLKRYQERCKYFEELEKKAPIDPKDNFDFCTNNKHKSNELQYQLDLDDMALFNDDMEIDRNQLTLHEVLGEGAFGLVKRGIYTDNKLGTAHEVAVKMLKDHPSADDVRAFRREIEVMKSVEKHPNIVGIIGHCTRYGNEMMLLTEYCSFGNLLNFLRDEWRFLHELQQKKQMLTTNIVDVELPQVRQHQRQHQQQQQHQQQHQGCKGLNTSVQFKYDNIHKQPPATATHVNNNGFGISGILEGSQGVNYQKLDKFGTLDEITAMATTTNQMNNKDNIVGIEELKTDNDVVERFKQKYNDLNATTTVDTTITNYVSNNKNNIKFNSKSKENLENLNNSTCTTTTTNTSSSLTTTTQFTTTTTTTTSSSSSTESYQQHYSTLNGGTTSKPAHSGSKPSKNAPTSSLVSPATENKSYGYHGCCTNSCKCDVDVIIRNIDSSDSSKETDELDRLLQRRQKETQNHQHGTKSGCTTIEIKNCNCKTTVQSLAHQYPNQQQQHKNNSKQLEQQKKQQEQQNQQYSVQLSLNDKSKNNSAVENKTYFKIFNTDKYYLARKQRSTTDAKQKGSGTGTTTPHHQSLTFKSVVPPPPLPTLATAKVKRKTKPPPLPLPPLPLPPPAPTQPQPPTIMSTSSTINDEWSETFNRVPLASGDLLDIAKQVAVGMDFLAKNKVVHRDLAARNVLVAPDRTVKIADFGLSRDVYQENMYKKTGNGKLPIKWLALESMTHQVYTTQSDVWSYGILLYEIVTLGATPYPSIPTNRLLHLLKTGYRMEKPKNCGQEFYDLMHSCWNGVPNERPTFHEIINKLNEMLDNLNNTNNNTATTTTPNTTETTTTTTTTTRVIPDNRDFIVVEEDNDLSKQESPIQQICSDDSYLKPL